MELLGRYLSDSKLYHNTFRSMGTRMDVILCGKEASRAEEIFIRVQRASIQIEGKLSWYREDSEITRINKNAFGKKIGIDPELMAILKECASYHEGTLGYFDPALGKLQDLRQDHRAEKFSQSEIDALKEATGWKYVQLDEEEGSIGFLSGQTSLDLGGYGKGYALQKIREILDQEDVRDALISFGESSVLALGHHPHGGPWRLGIQNAFDPLRIVHSLDLYNQSMSTSGLTPDNLRGKANGRGHLVNPHNAEALKGIRSLSVISRHPIQAEVLSTALILAPLTDRKKILSNYSGVRIVDVEYNDQNIASVLSLTN